MLTYGQGHLTTLESKHHIFFFLQMSGGRPPLDGEFDPGSGRTLAARLTHASRAVKAPLGGRIERRTGE